MADHFIDDETQELLGKIGIEFCVFGKFAQPRHLGRLASRIGGWQAMFSFVTADRLRHFEAFGQHEHKCRVDVIDAVAIMLQLRIGHRVLPGRPLP